MDDIAIALGRLFERFLDDATEPAAFAAEIVAAAGRRLPYGRIALFELAGEGSRALTDVPPADLVRVAGTLGAMRSGRELVGPETTAVWVDADAHRYALVGWSPVQRIADPAEAADILRVFVRVFGSFMRRRGDTVHVSGVLTDALTGLPGRAAVFSSVATALESARRGGNRAALLYVDLDGFKAVNDTAGHSAGDTLLIEIGRRLRAAARRGEMIGRIGGDEFAGFVPSLRDGDEAVEIAQRLLAALRDPVTVEGLDVGIGASIGIALFPDDGEDVDTLVRHADAAMYGAKRAGGGRAYLFSDRIRAQVEGRRRLRDDLRRATEGHTIGAEFLACYQPMLDVETRAVVGAEAFARWHHPREGVLTAEAIFAAMGTTSLGTAVDRAMVAGAVREGRAWHPRGIGAMHVNVSTPAAEIVADYDRLVGGDPLPFVLRLEASEANVMRSPDTWAVFAAECHRHGIGFGIDNFGRAPISLEVIERSGARFVKLDRELVGRIDPAVPHGAADAAIRIAQSFGLDVFAHGVATEAQADWLQRRNVRVVQGYAAGVPMTAADFDQWLSAGRGRPRPRFAA